MFPVHFAQYKRFVFHLCFSLSHTHTHTHAHTHTNCGLLFYYICLAAKQHNSYVLMKELRQFYISFLQGVTVLYPHVTDRIVPICKDDIVTLLSSEMPYFGQFTKGLQENLQGLGQGSIIFVYDPDKDDR